MKIHFAWESDWHVGSHLKEFDCYDEEPDSCEMCYAYTRDPETDEKIILAFLGCIDDATDAYRREIENELLAEAMIVIAGSESLVADCVSHKPDHHNLRF